MLDAWVLSSLASFRNIPSTPHSLEILQPMSRFVTVSYRAFVLWWVTPIFVHAVTAALFSFFAYLYGVVLVHKLSYLATNLWDTHIGPTRDAFPTIAVVFGLAALPHGLVILRMLTASLFYRSFAFLVEHHDLKASIYRLLGLKLGPGSASVITPPAQARSLLDRIRGLAAKLHQPAWVESLFGHKGLLGVEGKYLYLILFCREIVETSLQTNQAYRMSYYLPRVALNCWSTVLAHWRYKRTEANKRFIGVVCDCVLDLVAAVVIPCALIVTYIGGYDMKLYGFPMELWYNEVWSMHANHEFRVLFVAGWRDLATRMVFSVGMLVAISNVKDFLGTRHVSRLRENQVAALKSVSPVTPQQPQSAKDSAWMSKRHQSSKASPASMRRFPWSRFVASVPIQNRIRSASLVLRDSTYHHKAAHFVHAAMVVWGAVVLGFCLHAGSLPALSQCLLQTRPWGKPEPSCALVLLNCYESAINGVKEDVGAQLGQLDPEMVLQMTLLKVYNSSITEWSAEPALTRTHHSYLESLYVIRVNMTGGVLPLGLLSPEFPPTLADVELSTTNLRALPDDLDTKWPAGGAFLFECSEFTSIPDVVMQLRPFLLSFCGNPIDEVPAELFAIESVCFLHIGDNPRLKALPASATLSSTLGQFYLERTQITFFPSWLDGPVDFSRSEGFQVLRTVGTSYCEHVNPIFDRSLSDADAMAAVRGTAGPPMCLDRASRPS